MNQQLVKVEDEMNILQEIDETQKICSALMKTPHYSKMGEVGIFAIVQKAKSIGMHPLEALNGGMYFVQGKVEMQGQSMMAVIRQHGHSISLDPKSTDSHVIMHGKRVDNGDTWTVQFGIEDAKRAGIYRNQWEKYPKVMCQWRCVSMLGRFLFSDILKGVYVQGEISEAPALDSPVDNTEIVEIKPLTCSKEEADELAKILEECTDEYKEKIKNFLKKQKLSSLYELPLDTYVTLKASALKRRSQREEELNKEQEKKEQENGTTN